MQRIQDGARLVVRLDDGDDVLGRLTALADAEGWRAAFVVAGIGGIGAGALGYWNGKEYEPKAIAEFHELVALTGSIARVDGKPSVHLHASLGKRAHAVVAGHVLALTVENLAELYIETFPGRTWGRPINESLGLRTLDLDPEPDP